jgi:hypothetical protein
MAAALAYLPLRVVVAPTQLVGRVVVWLAEGYRSAPPLERVLILPSWAVLRGAFILGWTLSLALHAAARRSVA